MDPTILSNLGDLDYRTLAYRHGSSPETIEKCLERLVQITRAVPSEQAEKLKSLLPLVIRVMTRVDPLRAVDVLPVVVQAVTFIQPGTMEKVELFLPWTVRDMVDSGVDCRACVGLLISGIQLCNPRACYDFFTRRRYFPTFISIDEAHAKRLQYATQIFHGYDHLRILLQLHENAIRTRWLRKSRRKREKILRGSWPEIPTQHSPDLLALLQREMWNRDAPEWLWPHINLEDLATKNLFLIFLNARGRNPPHLFSHADLESCKLGRNYAQITPTLLDDYTMMFTARDSMDTYGELISWDEDPQAFRRCASGSELDVDGGMAVLNIQSRIYQFLLDCGLKIMGMDLESLRNSAAIAQDDPEPLPLSSPAPGANVLATIAAEASYRLPNQIDLSRLKSLIAAKLTAAENHIRTLREDPAYFAEAVLEVKEHMVHQIHNEDLITSPSLRESGGGALRRLFHFSFTEVVFWNDIHKRLERLGDLCPERYAHVKYEEALSPDTLFEFLLLSLVLERFGKAQLNELHRRACSSPLLRGLFDSRPPGDGSEAVIRSKDKANPQSSQQRFMRALFLLRTAQGPKKNIPDYLVTDEMERRAENDPETQKLLSPFVRATLSGLSLAVECRRQLNLYLPWAAVFEFERERQSTRLEAEYRSRFQGLGNLLEKMVLPNSLVAMGNPSNFHYPVDKPRSRKVTKALQKAEVNLDRFWREIDIFLGEWIGKCPDALKGLFQPPRPHRRTPNWVGPEQQESTAPAPPESTQKLTDVYQELELRTESTVDRYQQFQKTPKEKTRGIPRAPSPSALVEAPDPNLGDTNQATIIQVDRRALEVFEAMFFQPSQGAQPGEIDWHDFLHAMTSAGFDAEKVYGSVWKFTPRSAEMGHGIQFHEPHPVLKIPFRLARRYGRRLHRTYGWSADTFLCD